MSLVAQFDDLYRTMANHDDDLLPVMVEVFENQEACRQRWQAAEQRASKLAKENDCLKAANFELQANLKHTRAVLADELRKRASIEACAEALQVQLDQVRYIISRCGSQDMGGHTVRVLEKVLSHKSLADVSANRSVGSVLSPSYSQGSLLADGCASGEEGETSAEGAVRHRRRHSTPGKVASLPSPTATQHRRQSLGSPAKVHFELGDSKLGDSKQGDGGQKTDPPPVQGGCGVFATTMTMVSGEPGYVATVASQKTQSHVPPCQQRSRRSLSDPVFPAQQPATSTPNRSVVEEESGFVTGAEQLGPERRSTPVQPGEGSTPQQQHAFVIRLAASADDCVGCGKRIRFYRSSLRCLGCRAVCHPECKGLLPLLCVSGASPVQAKSDGTAATTATTTTTTGIQRGVVSDYAPSRSPMVPPLVVQCIQEVERRMAQEKGPLYGQNAPADQVDSLLAQYLVHRHLPPLDDCSTPVVCKLLLKFLASLRETLVTKSSWPFFAKAAECDHPEDRLWSLVGTMRGLPGPNLDTLSALLRHLHSVADTSLGGDGRSLEELASLFAPLLVGCSTNQPSAEVQKQDGTTQDLIMLRLLAVPSEYWMQPASDAGETDQPLYQTPPVPSSDLFGPIIPQSIKSKLRSAGLGFLEPRFRK